MTFRIEQVITFFMQMQKISNIPIVIFDGDHPYYNLSNIQDFEPNLSFRLLRSYALDNPGGCGTTVSPDYVFYGYICIQDSPYCAYIGPCTSFALSDRQIKNLLNEFDLPVSDSGPLKSYMRAFAKPLHSQFVAILELLHHMVNSPDSPVTYHAYPNKTASEFSEPSLTEPYLSRESQVSALEGKILLAIETGHDANLKDMLDHIGDFSLTMPQSSNTMNKTFSEIFITAAALSSRAAIKGGLRYDEAVDLQNYYLRMYDSVSSYLDFYNILSAMLMEFSVRVKKNRRIASDSPIVLTVIHRLQEHLYDTYSISDLASDTGYSESYLSHHLKKETGTTITETFLQMKIEEAKYLLLREDYSAAETAAVLSFGSSGYFQKAFKKRCGITPAEYKKAAKKIQSEDPDI